MAYKTKPELEEDNYIVYTNEPDTVVDSADIGGGGEGGGTGGIFEEYPFRVLFTPAEGNTISEGDLQYFEKGLLVNGEYISPEYEEGNVVYEFSAKALDLIDAAGRELGNNWIVDGPNQLTYGLIYAAYGDFPITASVPFYYAPPKSVIDSAAYKPEGQTFNGAVFSLVVAQNIQ